MEKIHSITLIPEKGIIQTVFEFTDTNGNKTMAVSVHEDAAITESTGTQNLTLDLRNSNAAFKKSKDEAKEKAVKNKLINTDDLLNPKKP